MLVSVVAACLNVEILIDVFYLQNISCLTPLVTTFFIPCADNPLVGLYIIDKCLHPLPAWSALYMRQNAVSAWGPSGVELLTSCCSRQNVQCVTHLSTATDLCYHVTVQLYLQSTQVSSFLHILSPLLPPPSPARALCIPLACHACKPAAAAALANTRVHRAIRPIPSAAAPGHGLVADVCAGFCLLHH
jgi:hypothetical protein